jgi:hypothetical protein
LNHFVVRDFKQKVMGDLKFECRWSTKNSTNSPLSVGSSPSWNSPRSLESGMILQSPLYGNGSSMSPRPPLSTALSTQQLQGHMQVQYPPHSYPNHHHSAVHGNHHQPHQQRSLRSLTRLTSDHLRQEMDASGMRWNRGNGGNHSHAGLNNTVNTSASMPSNVFSFSATSESDRNTQDISSTFFPRNFSQRSQTTVTSPSSQSRHVPAANVAATTPTGSASSTAGLETWTSVGSTAGGYGYNPAVNNNWSLYPSMQRDLNSTDALPYESQSQSSRLQGYQFSSTYPFDADLTGQSSSQLFPANHLGQSQDPINHSLGRQLLHVPALSSEVSNYSGQYL